jgi:hypothetical protein
MGVALVAWGRFFDGHGHRVTVPAPSTNPGVPWLLDFFTQHALALRQAGFTAIQLPPMSKAQGGAHLAQADDGQLETACGRDGLFDREPGGGDPASRAAISASVAGRLSSPPARTSYAHAAPAT